LPVFGSIGVAAALKTAVLFESWLIFARSRPSSNPPIITVAARGAPEFTQTLHSFQRLVRIVCIFGSEMSGSNLGTVSGVT